MKKRVECTIFGRVQMVMFRDFVSRNAKKLGVVGEVWNETDGTVRVIAEGDESQLCRLIDLLKRGSLLSAVEDVHVHYVESSGLYRDFRIIYEKNKEKEREDAVPAFYNFAASAFMRFSRLYSPNIHYQMRWPLDINRELAHLAHVADSDHILDAGCGQGGSLFWLARHYLCTIDAVTIGAREVSVVKKLIKRKKYTKRINVFEENMLNMHFTSGYFSLVWALESICHVHEKARFVNEAYRVLEPNGRIIVADLFLLKQPSAPTELSAYTNFCDGFLAPSVSTKVEAIQYFKKAGFRNVVYHDYSDAISGCVLGRVLSGVSNLIAFFPLRLINILSDIFWKNSLAMIAQGYLYRKKILSYGIITAEK
ncbi:MAG: hypothetical protein A2845_05815 [Candidatus Lloydbacteria bacterium RIFCSPHIGHO2_01_FULL_49_22]|uniref:acylphosphatase n=1 Tax=Candidatus Lloydbacteria bacterium RIFCSPHIGHO2_01_FULL_49_22 TaxID=1798658 RepID=A0A1G2CYA4_9BACT|nr:MAG: hypothetical protein A2845_05815 [Candidatus Lloydbacteria bacterium RIFCSPHIGHO2_01_FULL_49_22]OGZ09802.1 MAG: hypothetical protein A3C14_00200 [Candidatus Lloydbacteria bacterium RIFCSPHIGHO2_02_FULL_50_18]